MVSRSKANDPEWVDYQDLVQSPEILETHHLIINTTPLGTFPNTEEMPPVPKDLLTEKHKVYDLVYNPEETLLMRSVRNAGGTAKNGLDMLHLQAEASWEIWNRS